MQCSIRNLRAMGNFREGDEASLLRWIYSFQKVFCRKNDRGRGRKTRRKFSALFFSSAMFFFKMGIKLSIPGEWLSYADLPNDTVRLPMLVAGSNLENFSSPTRSNFAAEYNWNTKSSQNLDNLILFWRKGWYFLIFYRDW